MDMSPLGIFSRSELPFLIAAFVGVVLSVQSLTSGGSYLVSKLPFGEFMHMGIVPMVLGSVLMLGVLLAALGLVVEYLALIVTHWLSRSVLVEKECLNFSKNGGEGL